MRQILLSASGARVARMPRPSVDPGAVLVRVHYSLVSTGTELAGLKASSAGRASDGLGGRVGRAGRYLRAAVRDPGRALKRALEIARSFSDSRPPAARPAALELADFDWKAASARQLDAAATYLDLVTDESLGDYQALSQAFAVPEGCVPVLRLEGELEGGPVAVGLLDGGRERWVGSRILEAGAVRDRFVFQDTVDAVVVVIASAGSGLSARLRLSALSLSMEPAQVDGLPQSELDEVGWNVGYSLAGVVIAVGDGIRDLAPGDRVACAGAGQANHADYVAVPRRLVCPVPRGLPLEQAAFSTVGAIALQGVRRARPELGETVAVLGLGLIGQITLRLLRASGCRVVGLDLDPARVERAREAGLDAGASDPRVLEAQVRDLTGGVGVDRVLVTAATPSSAVVNLAMAVCRRKGTVVVVGDVGLDVERPLFYRKEIDLLMSTSYGPGRYDRSYEVDGVDYPVAYVRWTLNRNLQAFLDLAADGRLALEALIDRVVPVDRADEAYAELAAAAGPAPLGVLVHYPEADGPEGEPLDAPAIRLRGHREASEGPIGYALVGVGAFGTSMLVPLLEGCGDDFFLRGVVSRDTTRGGNFAREKRVEVLATELDAVLDDPRFGLVVIATRHALHASQVAASLRAGKHVFVEKPLATSWSGLEQVVQAFESRPRDACLTVGFNRRFSPAVRELRRRVAERRAPLVLSYRVNAGFLPPDHWVQGEEGAGRNIGEACHFYDVFRYLVGAPVRSIAAAAVDPGRTAYRRNDNFAATLTYEDGSVANLVYTALGPREGLGKERLEAYCDGDAYVLDDYVALTRAGEAEPLWRAASPDKGHAAEVRALAAALRSGGDPPIPFAEIAETTSVALHVEDLLLGRVGAETGG